MTSALVLMSARIDRYWPPTVPARDLRLPGEDRFGTGGCGHKPADRRAGGVPPQFPPPPSRRSALRARGGFRPCGATWRGPPTGTTR